MNVNLHIERLVIDGLPVGSHEGLSSQPASAAEIRRLIAQALPARGQPVRTQPDTLPIANGARQGLETNRAFRRVSQ